MIQVMMQQHSQRATISAISLRFLWDRLGIYANGGRETHVLIQEQHVLHVREEDSGSRFRKSRFGTVSELGQ